MNSEAIPFPTGPSNAQIYNHLINLTAALRRIFVALSEGGVDLTAIETAIADLETDVAAVQDVNYSFETAIAAQEVLGSFAEVANRAQTQLEINALATINAAIEAHRGTTGIRSLVSVSDAQAAQAAILAIRATDLEGATTTLDGRATDLEGATSILDGRVDSLDASTASIASQITSTTAALGVTNANVTALTTAVATGDAALAADINSLETTVAGNTASITTVQASVNGIATRYGVYLNAQNEVIGYLQLDGTPLGSVFTVAVDNFRVAKVGTTGGAAVPVFAIQTVNGTAKIAFVGDMIADGTITVNALAANSVVASKIAAGTITADKMNVTTLDAISANFGTMTAGLIRDTANLYNFEVVNGMLKSTDNNFKIDIKNKTIDIIF